MFAVGQICCKWRYQALVNLPSQGIIKRKQPPRAGKTLQRQTLGAHGVVQLILAQACSVELGQHPPLTLFDHPYIHA